VTTLVLPAAPAPARVVGADHGLHRHAPIVSSHRLWAHQSLSAESDDL
jgi:hypothetical protein